MVKGGSYALFILDPDFLGLYLVNILSSIVWRSENVTHLAPKTESGE